MNEIKNAFKILEPTEAQEERVWKSLDVKVKPRKYRALMIAAVVSIVVVISVIGINAATGGKLFEPLNQLFKNDEITAREAYILSDGDEVYAPEIVYLDNDKLVIEAVTGVIVYDRNSKKVIRTIDLQQIGGFYIDHGDDFGDPPRFKTHTLVENGRIIVFNTERNNISSRDPYGEAYSYPMVNSKKSDIKVISDVKVISEYYKKWLKKQKSYIDTFDTFYDFLIDNGFNDGENQYSYLSYVRKDSGKKTVSFIARKNNNTTILYTSDNKNNLKKEVLSLISDKKYEKYKELNKLPKYKYSGKDEVIKAVVAYDMKKDADSYYLPEGGVLIPAYTELYRTLDNNDVIVFMETWKFGYQRQGNMLEEVSGGEGTARYRLRKTENGYKVIEAVENGEGSDLMPSLEKMCKDYPDARSKVLARAEPDYKYLSRYIIDNKLKLGYRDYDGKIVTP